jgi:thiol-disulfide isomerase/thioredoxin
MVKKYIAYTVALLLSGGAVFAQDGASKAATLTIGDKAPLLDINTWVKGDPVTAFQPGTTYVIEFWATWCGPCIQSMPHISALQKEYADKNVRIIGVTSEDPSNNLDGVKKMVAAKGDTMGYTVAWDNARNTNTAYMDAAQQRGIPCSFVVDGKGNIAYIGHPATLDGPLSEIVAGTWDTTAAKAQLEAEQKADALMMKFSKAMGAGNADAAMEVAREVYKNPALRDNPSVLNEIAWTIVDPDSKLKNRDLDFALELAMHASELTKHAEPSILDTLARAQFLKGDIASAVATQTKAVELVDDPRLKPQLTPALEEYKAAAAAAASK